MSPKAKARRRIRRLLETQKPKTNRPEYVPEWYVKRRVSRNRHLRLLRMALKVANRVPATARGKKFANEALYRRRETMQCIKPVDNNTVPYDDPKYYYCIACGWPYSISKKGPCVPDELCRECHSLKVLGWLYV